MTKRLLEGVFFALVAVGASGCGTDKCGSERLEDGDYVLREGMEGIEPEWGFLVGAQVHVDRAARLMTIRYERDGSTYEVRYTLTP